MNKPLIILFFIALMSVKNINAQRANLDREYFNTSYVKLPTQPILDDSQRTFTSNERKIFLSGFSRINSSGTLNIEFDFHGTKTSDIDIIKRTHEEKDKDGNVTKTTYTYDLVGNYSSSGSVSISNSISGDSKSYSYNEENNYKKEGFKSYSKASDYYKNNKYNIRDEYRTKHRSSIISQINYKINSLYGYTPYTSDRSVHFWIIGTKKHPEYEKHQEAYQALKTIFTKMEFDQPLTEIEPELKPWIAYFEDVATRYTADDKKHRKVRYSSYYNLARIFMQLDKPEKTKVYANKIIENDYDKKDGKQFNKRADNLIELFKINQIKTRHFEVLTEDLSNEPEVTQVVIAAPMNDEDNSEQNIAFLITKNNDTLQTSISENELAKMSSIANALDDQKSQIQISAAESKKMVLTTGDVYESVEFASSLDPSSGNAAKFAKNIYKGQKVALFQHLGKELVLKFPDEEKTISTSDKAFVFGFNKKLAGFSNCEELTSKINEGAYKNTADSLIEFCKAFDNCSK